MTILKQANQFYPEYLKAHNNKLNRFLHFVGATQFFVICIIAFATHQYWLLALAIFLGYLLPGLGHHYLQHNESFRKTKPVLCVICATKLYFDTLFLQISPKMKHI
jgi:hypothetical protein